jgi:5-methylcytosine-specific restriction endonuclease McrA
LNDFVKIIDADIAIGRGWRMDLRSGRPPRFKLWHAPSVVRRGGREARANPHDRGLDEKWNRLSIRYRKQNPFCRMCEQEGNDAELVDVVDHILPRREYPALTYTWKNLQGLCRRHDGLKARMEIYARETGLLEMLTVWCEAIENRPAAVMAIPQELWVRPNAGS